MSKQHLQNQNSLLLNNLMEYYNKNGNLEKILRIINGESTVSLRLIDWFATNYSKKYFLKSISSVKYYKNRLNACRNDKIFY